MSDFVRRGNFLSKLDMDKTYADRLRGAYSFSYNVALPLYSLIPSRSGVLNHPAVFGRTSRWGYPDVRPFVPTVVEEARLNNIVSVESQPQSFCNSVEILQEFLDYIFPGHSLADLSFDTYMVNCARDLEVYVDNMAINLSKHRMGLKTNFDTLRPVLRTSVPFSRPNTQIQTLLAMVKRNLNIHEIQGIVAEERMVHSMKDSFIESYIPVYNKHMFKSFKNHPVCPNAVSLTEWLGTQASGVVDMIDTDTAISAFAV